MKRIITIAMAVMLLQACGNGEGGTVNDGFDGVGDANGALQDTAGNVLYDGTTDTAHGEHRVDLQQRNQGDTSTPR